MKVKVLTEHRYEGEPKKEGQTYELPDKLAKPAIEQGFVKAVGKKDE